MLHQGKPRNKNQKNDNIEAKLYNWNTSPCCRFAIHLFANENEEKVVFALRFWIHGFFQNKSICSRQFVVYVVGKYDFK